MKLAAAILIAALVGAGALAPRLRPPVPATAAADNPGSRLQSALEAIVARSSGQTGVAVMDLGNGAVAAVNGDRPFPQQSVVKLWVSIALLDAVDRGELRLDEPALVRRGDLSVFHQPMAERVGPGGYRTDIAELLRLTAVDSDNAANDILVRRLGGAQAVQQTLDRKALRGIRVDREERIMQAEANGLRWQPEFVDPATFEAARSALPSQRRTAALNAYLRDPRDTATPVGSVAALARLAKGELLSPASTALVLRHMNAVSRGADRLKAGAPGGWSVGHRPGTAGQWQGRGIVLNDIGLLTAPDGHAYAVAVFIADSRKPDQRAATIASVARAVVRSWEESKAR